MANTSWFPLNVARVTTLH